MMNWRQLLSDRRVGAETRQGGGGDYARSEFERDYDRLVFSPPFRRLQNKTQVFPLPGNVFVHNRLTHSLEVSCVGRSLGNMVGTALQRKYPDLGIDFRSSLSAIVSAACLAHDMGNPPFGHSGERAIGAYFTEGNGLQWREAVEAEGHRWSDFTHFEGNANALRLLTHQFLGRRAGGFALSYSTIASIIKYPYSSECAGGHGKFGFFQTEEATMRDLAEELGLIRLSGDDEPLRYARYPLVYLVEASDDICYQVMDIEDAYKLNILSYEEAKSILSSFLDESERVYMDELFRDITDANERIGYLRSRAINALVEETAQIFIEHEEQILSGVFTGGLLSHLSEPRNSAMKYCSQVAWDRIYRSKMVIDMELAGHRIFTSLLDKLLHALAHPEHLYSKALLDRVSSQYNVHETSCYGRIQCALDYISGMTDLYALDLYRRITGMNLPAV